MTPLPPELAALYQRIILEHNARPHNHGPLPARTHEASAHNPLCGDSVTVRLRLDGGLIAEARFEGEGCALSRASASLLTLAVSGRGPEEALAIAAGLFELLGSSARSAPPAAERAPADLGRLGDLAALQGVREVRARLRCATLPWEALRAALGEKTVG
jgi:nitrogen fixation NifU-like protein